MFPVHIHMSQERRKKIAEFRKKKQLCFKLCRSVYFALFEQVRGLFEQ
jgi:hypothetical protein